MLATNYPILDIFLTTLYFFLFIIWIWLLFMVFIDIFRSHDMGGWAKALWVIFIIVLPYLGVLVYLIARGGNGIRSAAIRASRKSSPPLRRRKSPPANESAASVYCQIDIYARARIRLFRLCHVERSRDISEYFCPDTFSKTKRARDSSTSLGMTEENYLRSVNNVGCAS